jgi:methionyl-tRNA formyltransferase
MVRAVFMGSDEFSLPVLQKLVTHGPNMPEPVQVVAVVAAPDRPSGRGRQARVGPVAAFAREREIDLQQPPRIRAPEALEAYRSAEPELVVVASYGQILPRAVLDEPRHHCLNLHPSLLPKYRGTSPVPSVILAGDDVTGTTLMVMSPRMDAGPILAQERTSVGRDETGGELLARLAALSAELLLVTLPMWLRGELQPRDQDEREATYTNLLAKTDGVIDWELPAAQIARIVRAFNPWPSAQTILDGQLVRLLRAHTVAGMADPGRLCGCDRDALLVGTGEGLLAVTQLQFAGGRPMSGDAALRGRPNLLTSRFEAGA